MVDPTRILVCIERPSDDWDVNIEGSVLRELQRLNSEFDFTASSTPDLYMDSFHGLLYMPNSNIPTYLHKIRGGGFSGKVVVVRNLDINLGSGDMVREYADTVVGACKRYTGLDITNMLGGLRRTAWK